jgi:hypothetical protein
MIVDGISMFERVAEIGAMVWMFGSIAKDALKVAGDLSNDALKITGEISLKIVRLLKELREQARRR